MLRHTYERPRAPPRDRHWRTHTRSPPGRSRPEGGPLTGRRGGTLEASHAPSCTSTSVWAELAGLGDACTSASSRFASFIFMNRWRRGPARPQRPALALNAPPPAWDPAPAEAQAPAGRPRLPLWGGSFHLVTTQKCVAAAPPCPRVCLWGPLRAREGAQRPRKGLLLSPGKGRRKRRVDRLLAVSVPEISLFSLSCQVLYPLYELPFKPLNKKSTIKFKNFFTISLM